MSEDGLKRRLARRAPVLLVALSIGLVGIGWSGCGDDSSSDSDNVSTGEIQERIEQGSDAAKQGIERAKEEVRKGFENAEKEAKGGVSKGTKEAQKGIEKAQDEAQKAIEEAERRVQGY